MCLAKRNVIQICSVDGRLKMGTARQDQQTENLLYNESYLASLHNNIVKRES